MSKNVIGVDLGGTKCAVAVYEVGTWNILAHDSQPTDAHIGLPAVMDRIAKRVLSYKTTDTISIGMGLPGLVRRESGIIQHTPNIPGGDGFPVQKFLATSCALPAWVDNDARCFTLAEARMGAGKGHAVVVGITMGTGVGGGIVVDGTLLHGAHGFAGEIGHMLLRPGEPPIKGPHTRGDVEQFLSGTALGRRCEPAEKPQDYLDGRACAFLWPDVFREIAWMVASLTHLVDPSVIVFGGSTGRALKPHLQTITKELHQWLLPETPPPLLSIASREDSGTLGAALLSQQEAKL